MDKFATFDAADYLDDGDAVVEYITAALEDPKPDVLLTAVRDVAITTISGVWSLCVVFR